MMRALRVILRIARTEVLEHRRQPWMIVILAANYAVLICIFSAIFLLFDNVWSQPDKIALLKQQMSGIGFAFDTFLRLATSSYQSLLFTNLPLFVAIMSGTSVIHDRECGTMPFLMLAPITRRHLLLGKLAGAMSIPVLLHLGFVGVSSLMLGHLKVLEPYAGIFGASPAWWVALLAGAPASAAFVGSLGTVISALSRDIRTSMQYTSFFIGFLSLGIGFVLVDAVAEGVALQIGFAIGCLVATSLTLLIGAKLISQDFASS